MSEHVQRTIDDLKARRATLDDVIDKLEWFQREFPHTAAGLVATGTGTGGTPSSKRSKLAARVKRTTPTALADDLKDLGDRVVAVLRAKSPQRVGDVLKAANVKIDRSRTTRLLIKLAEAGRIVRSGVGRGAMVALPGKTPARGHL